MRRAGPALLLVLLPALLPAAQPGSDAPRAGRETGLPIDTQLVGAWWRGRTARSPAEAVHYSDTGRYLRVGETGPVEKGIWVTWVRGPLRWLRRCPARGGGAVSPADCDYFGRYLIEESEAVEEVACGDAWQGSLTGGLSFQEARDRCPVPTLRFADIADENALREKVEEAKAAAPPPEVTRKPKRPPAKAGGQGGGDVGGTWVGTVGAGPEKVTLTFTAQDSGAFTYSLEAGGQEETSSGKWQVDNAELILEHPDGEVEKIPFTVEDDVLKWSDEDLGVLVLQRKG